MPPGSRSSVDAMAEACPLAPAAKQRQHTGQAVTQGKQAHRASQDTTQRPRRSLKTGTAGTARKCRPARGRPRTHGTSAPAIAGNPKRVRRHDLGHTRFTIDATPGTIFATGRGSVTRNRAGPGSRVVAAGRPTATLLPPRSGASFGRVLRKRTKRARI